MVILHFYEGGTRLSTIIFGTILRIFDSLSVRYLQHCVKIAIIRMRRFVNSNDDNVNDVPLSRRTDCSAPQAIRRYSKFEQTLSAHRVESVGWAINVLTLAKMRT